MFVLVQSQLFHQQQFLDQLNQLNLSWKHAIPSRFEGYTKTQIYSLFNHNQELANIPKTILRGEVPSSLDYRVTSPECVDVIRDMKGCHSHHAFVMANILSDNRCLNKIDKTRIQYSEQYIQNCDTSDVQCNGGTAKVVQRFMKFTGTVTDRCQPLKNAYAKCSDHCWDRDDEDNTKTKGFEDICYDEESIMVGLQSGTVHAGMFIYEDFMYYESGIYYHALGKSIGAQFFQIVGYGEENNVKYWIGKNYLGRNWGEDGFFRIVRGQNESNVEEECFLTKLE
ncbi:Cathepsin B [Spironucleus salmonicida]|uniref:Cathepsin B n=1 Tax=Spironucleus salmonicida TaxID=348837 RepID=V6LG81_9EUKA|nr:Cathepsin B [Spironucleus salmonicida]|eukprot:EST43298.1 Papain family cysteine protease [Spironucleus salmonicida]